MAGDVVAHMLAHASERNAFMSDSVSDTMPAHMSERMPMHVRQDAGTSVNDCQCMSDKMQVHLSTIVNAYFIFQGLSVITTVGRHSKKMSIGYVSI